MCEREESEDDLELLGMICHMGVELVYILLCCPCAEHCFSGEDEKCAKYSCAASQSGVLNGTITTVLSSGAYEGVSKSSAGLGFGITALVLGTVASVGLCAYHYGHCGTPCVRSSSVGAVAAPEILSAQLQPPTAFFTHTTTDVFTVQPQPYPQLMTSPDPELQPTSVGPVNIPSSAYIPEACTVQPQSHPQPTNHSPEPWSPSVDGADMFLVHAVPNVHTVQSTHPNSPVG